ncbi:MAG: hypothetical protein K6G89_05170 [Clostridia bacterium]|nr:hypothetical protein [Clostridia bacterium]
MVLLFLMLWSLSILYFVHLLETKSLKLGAISVAICYIGIVFWIYFVFICDVSDFGFMSIDPGLLLLEGGPVYCSFIRLTYAIGILPLSFLEVIVTVAVVIIVSGILVAIHGTIEFAKAVVTVTKEKNLFSTTHNKHHVFNRILPLYKEQNIIRIHCRMNC